MKPCPGKSFDSQVKKLAEITIDFNFEMIKKNSPKKTCIGNNGSKTIKTNA